jgi:hypothetical protein
MTQMPEPSPAPEQAPPEKAVPPPVAALAAEHDLGRLRNARILPDVGAIFRPAAVLGVPSLVLVAVGITRTGVLGVLGLVGLVGVVLALIVAAYATKTWIAGADDWYLYAEGIVAAQRRRLRPITWPEVASLARQRMGRRARRRATIITPDTLRGYRMTLKDGTSTFLTVGDFFEDGKRFARQLEELATSHQIPVTG